MKVKATGNSMPFLRSHIFSLCLTEGVVYLFIGLSLVDVDTVYSELSMSNTHVKRRHVFVQ